MLTVELECSLGDLKPAALSLLRDTMGGEHSLDGHNGMASSLVFLRRSHESGRESLRAARQAGFQASLEEKTDYSPFNDELRRVVLGETSRREIERMIADGIEVVEAEQ